MVKYLSIDNLQALDIGHVSDNQTGEVSIDCSAWRRKYPALTEYNLFVTNPRGMIYPANTVMTEDGKLLWNICDADTSVPGVGRYQIIATGRYGDRKASKFADLTIAANMPGMDGAAPPDPSKAWAGDVIAARREAENAARAAADSAEAVAHPPIIGENGNWWLWDNEQKAYVDSGFDSRPDAAPYTLPTASETVKGGVKVGDGLQMTGDVLGVKADDELIAHIKVTGADTYTIQIDNDTDGNPFDLTYAKIRYSSPINPGNNNNAGTNVVLLNRLGGSSGADRMLTLNYGIPAPNKLAIGFGEIFAADDVVYGYGGVTTENNSNMQFIYSQSTNGQGIKCFEIRGSTNRPFIDGAEIIISGKRREVISNA